MGLQHPFQELTGTDQIHHHTQPSIPGIPVGAVLQGFQPAPPSWTHLPSVCSPTRLPGRLLLHSDENYFSLY